MSEYVIVGGSSGIGLSLSTKLASAGHHVTVVSRHGEALAGVDGIDHISCDVRADDLSDMPLPSRIDGFAYCPGTINLKPFRALKPDAFRDDFEINVIGAVKGIQAAMQGLRAADNGAILLFSTVAVGQGMPAHATIAASKGAIEGLTRSLAAELAPKIRVNCLAPALTRTPMTQKFFTSEERAASLAEQYPLGRTGEPDDIAAAGLYLLGTESSWVTGQVLGVDGGLSALRT